MKKFLIAVLLSLFCVHNLYALNVSGINIEDTIILNNVPLKLNGYGIRKKWFVKVYIAALYTTKPTKSYAELLKDTSEKILRLHFLHKVEKSKVTDSIREAFLNITPDLPESEAGKKFFSQFNNDFNVGDVLEILFLPDGTVVTKHNNKTLNMIKSYRLVYGLLSIYLGDKPVDVNLRNALLGAK